MPCRCDYMDPSARERESRNVAELLVWAAPKTGKPVSQVVRKAATDPYGNIRRVDEFTRQLCEVCRCLPEAVIYNGKDKMARRLADWWDAHQEADAARETDEKEARHLSDLRTAALGKLTGDERKALDL